MRFFDRMARRNARAKRQAAEAEKQRQDIEAQWPEVRELSSWARETRERNHLAALFVKNLGGGG